MMNSCKSGILYLGPEKVFKYLNGEWKALVSAVESALKHYSEGKVVQPVRAAVPVDKHEGLLLAMPAYDQEMDSMAVKVGTVFPQNRRKGLSAVQALILLYNTQNGKLKAILDGEFITGMRTAASSVVATKYLASSDSEYLAILGAGTQARSHYQALCNFYNFKKIFVWNVNADSAKTLVEEICAKGLPGELCSSVEHAVKAADIIVTATMAKTPILKKEWIKAGAHINAVGAPVPEWQELDNDLTTSAVLYVDSIKGALAESGDIIKSGAEIYAEIGDMLLGVKDAFPNRTTIFKSLGMAVEDVVAAEIVYENYCKHAENV